MNWQNYIFPALVVNIIGGCLTMVRLWRDSALQSQAVKDLKEEIGAEKQRNDEQDLRLRQQDTTLGRIDENVKSIKETLARLEKQN